MAARSGLYDFDLTGQEVQRGLPPIVGDEGGSTWLSGGGHFQGELGLAVENEVWIGIDLQSDSFADDIVLGAGVSAGDTIQIAITQKDDACTLSLLLRDGSGRALEAVAQGCRARARRILFQAVPSENRAQIFENTPWAENPGEPLPLEIVRGEGPGPIHMPDPFALGGWNIDGERQGSFGGRMANFFVGTKPLPEGTAARYARGSTNPMGISHADLGHVSEEMRARFLRDLQRLRGWCAQAALSPDDLDDASLLLHRWLLDRTAILDVITRRSGVQLWLPGPSDGDLQYQEAVIADGPLVQIQGEVGPDGPMGFNWVGLPDWRSAHAFHANGAPVSREAFIKFVRNKLGSGHFDEDDRKRWQRDLLSVTSGLSVMGQSALAFQMHSLLREVSLAVSVSRAEFLAAQA